MSGPTRAALFVALSRSAGLDRRSVCHDGIAARRRFLDPIGHDLCCDHQFCCTSTASPTSGPVALDGWKLTLPVAGPRGTAAAVDPAQLSPPWLTETPAAVSRSVPADGATTAQSAHARTELNSLDTFPAGAAPHTLAASLSVAQVPAAGQDVILDFTIADNGNGTSTFTATHGQQVATRDAPLPAAFRGATVRFQAGAYQLSGSAPGAAAGGDGARVIFHSLTTQP